MSKFFGSICLTDIPRELIKEKNGKKYLSVVVAERRTPSQYGYTHYIKAYAKSGEVEQGVNLYIGELKPSKFEDQPTATTATAPATTPNVINNDGLPF